MSSKTVAAFLVFTALVCTGLARAGRTQKITSQTNRPSPQSRAEKKDRRALLKDALETLLTDVTVTDESLRETATKPGKPRAEEGYTMLRVVWTTNDPAAPARAEFFRSDPTSGPPLAGRTMRVTGRRKMKGSLAQPRGLDLSSEDVLMAAVDAGGQLRYWYVFADPRVVGEEEMSAPGEAEGRPRRTFHLARVKFYVGVPDDPAITELRFYHPRWTGTEHALDALGTIRF